MFEDSLNKNGKADSTDFRPDNAPDCRFEYLTADDELTCVKCAPYDGIEVNESDIKSLFPFAVKTSSTTYAVNKHKPRDGNCRCTLELIVESEENEPLLPQYAYFKEDASGELVVNEHANEGPVPPDLKPRVLMHESELPKQLPQELPEATIFEPEQMLPQPIINKTLPPIPPEPLDAVPEEQVTQPLPSTATKQPYEEFVNYAYFAQTLPETVKENDEQTNIPDSLRQHKQMRTVVKPERVNSVTEEKRVETLQRETSEPTEQTVISTPTPTAAEDLTNYPHPSQQLQQIAPSAPIKAIEQPANNFVNFAYFGAAIEQLENQPRRLSQPVRAFIKLLQLQRKEVNATETNETDNEQPDFTESPVTATPRLKKTNIVRLMRSLRSTRSLEMQGGRIGLQALGVGRPEAMAITSILIPIISMIVKEEIDLALRAHNVQMEKQRSDEFRNAYRSVNPA